MEIPTRQLRDFSDAMQFARRAVNEWHANYHRLQCKAYLHHHKRLPGSLRTKRLRKKRETKVDRWFNGLIK